MTVRAIRALFEAERIGFVPGGREGSSAGHVLAANLRAPSLAVPVEEVSRRGRGEARLDLGVIALPNRDAAAALERLGRRGCRAVVLVDTGLRRAADAARESQALRTLARELGVRALGPSRGGVIVPATGLNAGTVHDLPRRGKLALITQSDSVLGAMLDRAAARGIGFSRIASVGKSSDVVLGDLLDYLAADDETDAVLVHLERIADPRRFVSAARAVAWTKPALVLRGGRSRDPATDAPTLLGSAVRRDDVYDAVFRRTGLVRVASVDALFDAADRAARSSPTAPVRRCSQPMRLWREAGSSPRSASAPAGRSPASGFPACANVASTSAPTPRPNGSERRRARCSPPAKRMPCLRSSPRFPASIRRPSPRRSPRARRAAKPAW